MPAFTSGRYPQLQVRTVHGTVRFADGRAEVSEDQAEVLRGMDASYELAELAGAPVENVENVEGVAPPVAAPSAPVSHDSGSSEDSTSEGVAHDGEPSGATPAVFDPGEHSVGEVLAHLAEADTEEAERVLAAEEAGKKRKGVLAARETLASLQQEE